MFVVYISICIGMSIRTCIGTKLKIINHLTSIRWFLYLLLFLFVLVWVFVLVLFKLVIVFVLRWKFVFSKIINHHVVWYLWICYCFFIVSLFVLVSLYVFVLLWAFVFVLDWKYGFLQDYKSSHTDQVVCEAQAGKIEHLQRRLWVALMFSCYTLQYLLITAVSWTLNCLNIFWTMAWMSALW